jgi:outer membrane biogenesis lipoprotein LolB
MWYDYEPDFHEGDIIEFCGDTFEVLKNYGCTGKVRENCQDGAIIGNFYWEYQGTQCKLVKRVN